MKLLTIVCLLAATAVFPGKVFPAKASPVDVCPTGTISTGVLGTTIPMRNDDYYTIGSCRINASPIAPLRLESVVSDSKAKSLIVVGGSLSGYLDVTVNNLNSAFNLEVSGVSVMLGGAIRPSGTFAPGSKIAITGNTFAGSRHAINLNGLGAFVSSELLINNNVLHISTSDATKPMAAGIISVDGFAADNITPTYGTAFAKSAVTISGNTFVLGDSYNSNGIYISKTAKDSETSFTIVNNFFNTKAGNNLTSSAGVVISRGEAENLDTRSSLVLSGNTFGDIALPVAINTNSKTDIVVESNIAEFNAPTGDVSFFVSTARDGGSFDISKVTVSRNTLKAGRNARLEVNANVLRTGSQVSVVNNRITTNIFGPPTIIFSGYTPIVFSGNFEVEARSVVTVYGNVLAATSAVANSDYVLSFPNVKRQIPTKGNVLVCNTRISAAGSNTFAANINGTRNPNIQLKTSIVDCDPLAAFVNAAPAAAASSKAVAGVVASMAALFVGLLF